MHLDRLAAASIAVLCLTSPMVGQTQQQAPQPLPQLIKTGQVVPQDSPLVRAAKYAVRVRQQAPGKRLTITQSELKRGRVSQGSGPARVSTYSSSRPSTMAEPGPDEEALKREQEMKAKVAALKQEQERMAQEAEEGPYGLTTEEDQVEARQTQIPQEIETIERPPS